MEIISMPISQCIGWSKNPRSITPENFERLKTQIKTLGVYKPLLATKEDGHYIILGGNMRLKAFADLGIAEVQISVVDAPDEATKLRYALSDNDAAGRYDVNLLGPLIAELPETELKTFHVDMREHIDLGQALDTYNARQVKPEDDALPEKVETRAKRGQVWQLGDHRLMCGDATNTDDTDRLMGGEKAQMILTDPPYGVSYGEKNKFLNAISPANRIQESIVNDNNDCVSLENIFEKAFANAFRLSSVGAAFYSFAPQGGDQMMMMMMIIKAKFNPTMHQLILEEK